MVYLAVASQYLGFGDLPDHKRIVKSGRLKIKRAGRANHIRRVGFNDILYAQVVEPLKMKRLIRLESGKFFERGDRLLVIAFSHGSFHKGV